MSRAVDIHSGRIYVVTDLHGDWSPYVRYRDHFLSLYDTGDADTLVFLGDVIHGYGAPEEDYSLPILWDIMRLQAQLGPEGVIMLMGNHELPHIYGVTLAKGEQIFTPRFEHSLGEYRQPVIDFLRSLPFLVRTAAGVMLTHAGAAESTAIPDAAGQLLDFSHESLLAEVDELLLREDVFGLVERTLGISEAEYASRAWQNLAITGAHDPRYLDLLRGFVVANLEPEWSCLWDFFFTQCERNTSPFPYEKVLDRFLHAYSAPNLPQHILVTGHMPVRNGRENIAGKQLRIASWAHAQPKTAGCALLFDAEQPVKSVDNLLKSVFPMP